MDLLFQYNSFEMLDKLREIEDEMREDSYVGSPLELQEVSEAALEYIHYIFEYMKECYKESKCTILSAMEELNRVSVTGEYVHLLNFSDINFKSSLFEKMRGETGYEEVLYAMRLLRYYYLVKEKNMHLDDRWEEVQNVYDKIREMNSFKIFKKKDKLQKETPSVKEDEFMLDLRKHMDKYMIGQDVLKKKLCTTIYQFKYYDVRTTLLMIGPSGSGKNHMIETVKSFPGLGLPVISYDCSSLTPTGFTGADVDDLFRRVRNFIQPGAKCIVYLDEIDKIINYNHDSHGESVNAVTQQQLLSSLAGTEVIHGIDTSKVLFILGGSFPRIDELRKSEERKSIGFNATVKKSIDYTEDLRSQIIAIGGEVEFVGRIEEIVQMSKLSRDDLKAILLDEHIGVLTKKKKLYENAGLHLEVKEDAIEEILNLIEKDTAGARSVKNIINQFTDSQYFYDMKVEGYDTMLIHKGMITGEKPILLRGENDAETITCSSKKQY